MVGTQRLGESPYFWAKMMREKLAKQSDMPHSIVQATQFFEFLKQIAESATDDGVVRLPHALIQPIVAYDAATAVIDIAVGEPMNGCIEFADPQLFATKELIRTVLSRRGDARPVVGDAAARYFGALLDERPLLPDAGGIIANTRYDDWVSAAG